MTLRANTNAWKACFWTLGFIIRDALLLATIREEVAPIVQSTSSPNELASRLRRCPKLNSAYNETLRLGSNTGSLRQSLTDAKVAGKTIKAGNQIIVSYRRMMLDSDTFGERPTEFLWDRFLHHDTLTKSESFRPFGGGVGQCPGRFLSQSEILMLIALTITRYDLALEGSLAEMDIFTPSSGMMGPVAGQKTKIRMRAHRSQ